VTEDSGIVGNWSTHLHCKPKSNFQKQNDTFT
jgi:hypothetical protein